MRKSVLCSKSMYHNHDETQQRTRRVTFGDLLCAAIERNDRLRPWSQRLDLWSHHLRRFQRETAKKIRSLRPRVVLCYDTCSRQIFEAAREVGAMCVLDQSIGHITRC